MAAIPPELDNRQPAPVPSTAERRLSDAGCLALVVVCLGLGALVLLAGARPQRRPVLAQPASAQAAVSGAALLPSAGEPVATAAQLVAEGMGTPAAAAALGVAAGVTAFDAALQGTPAPALPAAPTLPPTLPPAAAMNVVQDGGLLWRCPNGCPALPICADGAPLKAYTRADPAGGAGAVTRVYFTREVPGYGDLPVNAAAGDLWFCTEDEARAAGFVRGQ